MAIGLPACSHLHGVGPGNDKLAGGTDRDVLIGGAGSDRIANGGGLGEDLLISGSTSFATGLTGLTNIFNEWTSGSMCEDRILFFSACSRASRLLVFQGKRDASPTIEAAIFRKIFPHRVHFCPPPNYRLIGDVARGGFHDGLALVCTVLQY